jgi:flap endonuclease-1
MGIKNLMKIIQRFAPNSIKTVTIKDFTNKKIAIDANLMLFKLVGAIRYNNYDIFNKVNGENKSVVHIHTLLMKLIGFVKYNITPIFVFDGKAPDIKAETIEERKKIINKISINAKEYNECIALIKLFGFAYIDSPEEADSQCAQLLKDGVVDYIVSDDLDMLIFGAGNLVKNFSIAEKKKFQLISLDQALIELGINFNQLVELGILLGSDYYKITKKRSLGTITSYKYIKKYKTIKNIIKNVPDLEHDTKNITIVKDYFMNPTVIKNFGKIKQAKVSFVKLERFLLDSGFNKEKYIDYYLNKIRK